YASPRGPRALASRTDIVVFAAVAVLMLTLVGWGGFATDSLATVTAEALEWLIVNLGWFFVLSATGFVAFALYLAFSRFGRVPLGGDDEEPEFRTASWIAMMFSAGMGIGLMFFGVSEPLSHFLRSEEHTSELQSRENLVCRLLLEKKKKKK